MDETEYWDALRVVRWAMRWEALRNADTFAKIAAALPDSRVRDRLLEFAEVPTETPVKDIAARFGSSGWVVETVPLALFVGLKMKQKTLESALTELPEPVEDADTIGSIAGQIAGARLGFARLPESLVSLPFVAAIQHAADGLASFVPEK